MWVIYDTDTGWELDRVEDLKEANKLVRWYNSHADYDHYDKRWEE